MFFRIAILTACFVFSAHANDLWSGRVVDLTHPFNEQTVYLPTARMFEKTEVFKGQTDAGFFYSAYNFSAAEHGGTHMDSPIHFAFGANTADQVPISQLIGPGFVIDVSAQVLQNVDYLVTAIDILEFESEHGRIPKNAIVLINTGRAGLYPDREAYMGEDGLGPGRLEMSILSPCFRRCLGFARGPEQNDLHQSGCDSLPPNHEVCLRVDSRLLSSRPCS